MNPSTAPAALGAAIEDLLPDDVRSGVLAIDDRHVAALHASEAERVRDAVPARRREFATGRVLLRQLTGTSAPVGATAARAPVLPAGWVGSLAHTDRIAVAAVAPSASYVALGVDLEPCGPMGPDELAVVLRVDDPDLDGRAALVLKEAAYKAWSGLGGPLIDFQDVRLEVDGGRFVAATPRPDVVLHGRWAGTAGHWLAAVTVPAPV